jgi:hypothetical protein
LRDGDTEVARGHLAHPVAREKSLERGTYVSGTARAQKALSHNPIVLRGAHHGNGRAPRDSPRQAVASSNASAFLASTNSQSLDVGSYTAITLIVSPLHTSKTLPVF